MTVVIVYSALVLLSSLLASGLMYRRGKAAHHRILWSLGSFVGSTLVLAGFTYSLYSYFEYHFVLMAEEKGPLIGIFILLAIFTPLIVPWLFFVFFVKLTKIRKI